MEMKDLVLKASRHQDDLDEMEDANLKKNTLTNSVISQTQSEEDNIFSRVMPSVVAGGSVADMVTVIDSIKLNDVLGQSASFDAFALHVAKEISIEMLFTQLLQYLFDNFEEYISPEVHTKEVNDILADLPATVPQSYILRTATKGEGVREHRRGSAVVQASPKKSQQEVMELVLFMGSSLYNKYVKKNAHWEINISSHLRKQFVEMFTGFNDQQQAVDLDLNAVIRLFVEGEKAMHTLLSYSFTRFKMKRDFERMLASSFRPDRSQHRPSHGHSVVPAL